MEGPGREGVLTAHRCDCRIARACVRRLTAATQAPEARGGGADFHLGLRRKVRAGAHDRSRMGVSFEAHSPYTPHHI